MLESFKNSEGDIPAAREHHLSSSKITTVALVHEPVEQTGRRGIVVLAVLSVARPTSLRGMTLNAALAVAINSRRAATRETNTVLYPDGLHTRTNPACQPRSTGLSSILRPVSLRLPPTRSHSLATTMTSLPETRREIDRSKSQTRSSSSFRQSPSTRSSILLPEFSNAAALHTSAHTDRGDRNICSSPEWATCRNVQNNEQTSTQPVCISPSNASGTLNTDHLRVAIGKPLVTCPAQSYTRTDALSSSMDSHVCKNRALLLPVAGRSCFVGFRALAQAEEGGFRSQCSMLRTLA